MNTVSEPQHLISHVSAEEWKQELENASSKYHIIGAWIAIIFDPLFAFTDYINLSNAWLHLLSIRLGIAAITLCLLLVRKKYKLPSYVVILVPFLLISFQNAYTYNLIHNEVILEHSLNYMALLIGAAMFILWEWMYSLVVFALSVGATTFFVFLNPNLSEEQFLVKGGFLLMTVGAFMIVLIKARYDLTVKEIKARLALKATNEELGRQKEIVELSSKKITDSILYAKRIQESILGHQSRIETWFADSFVFFRPKDILSGDFYWFYEDQENQVKIVIAADCTGHGVPAALMTVLGNSILNEVVIQDKVYEPDQILYALDRRLMESLSKRSEEEGKVNDGMDVAILSFVKSGVTFASAKNPLCIIHEGNAEVISGSKFPIGSTQYGEKKIFDKHILSLSKGDKLYLYSDGYPDQFGGEHNKKFLSKRFRELLLQTSHLPMGQQKEKLIQEFEAWKGAHNPNTDDVLVVGITW